MEASQLLIASIYRTHIVVIARYLFAHTLANSRADHITLVPANKTMINTRYI